MSKSTNSDVIYLLRVLFVSRPEEFSILLPTFLMKDCTLYLDKSLEDHYMPDKFEAVIRMLMAVEICTSSPIIS